ncbi:hypothetical protein, partial [uncultured Muribaculum sp.]
KFNTFLKIHAPGFRLEPELFLYVGFDNVLNALRNTHRTCRSIKSVASYKEAFDTICLIEFEGAGERSC